MSIGLGKTQKKVLDILKENKSMSIGEIAEILYKSKQFSSQKTAAAAVSRACTNLKKRGLVRKKTKSLKSLNLKQVIIELKSRASKKEKSENVISEDDLKEILRKQGIRI